MRSNPTLSLLGAATLAAAVLAACGGGGGGGTHATPLGAAPTSTPLGGAQGTSSTARITLTIPKNGTQSHK
ncbi:MAG: hypothetical protein ABR975_00005, partial [Vulcanimicrobiaceae bacterium]